MSGDSPITTRAEDQLGRAHFADQLAIAVRAMTAERGMVIGLVGPWGSGKTSVLNLVAEQLDREPKRTVVWFNPWMFSGTEQLVHSFFEQLAAQLRLGGGRRQRRLAGLLVDYGQAVAPLMFVPVAGVWLARAGALAAGTGKLMNSRSKIDPINVQRAKIEQALGDLPEPLVVILDDIDRLMPHEVRDVVRLVRLTASFPKIVYLLAYDRGRVERALGDDTESGRAYLEKIIEIDFDLPQVPDNAVIRILAEQISATLDGQTTGPFDEQRWPDVLVQVLRPLFRTVRDVNRYIAVLPATLASIGDEVALVDVLALEAVRVRRPDVFALLAGHGPTLTRVGMLPSDPNSQQNPVDDLLAETGEDRVAIAAFLKLIFPATERYQGGLLYGSDSLPLWRRQRRVASPEVFTFYLSRVLPADAVTAATVDLAVASLADPPALQTLLDSLEQPQVEDLLGRLEVHIPEVPSQSVLPACTTLLNLYPRLRRDSKGFLDPGGDFLVDRLVLRFLRRCEDDADRVEIVRSLCADVPSYIGRLHLLDIVGWYSATEARLVPADVKDELLQQLCAEIRHASAADITSEPYPLDVLAAGLAEAPADREAIDTNLTNDALAAAVLRSALDEVRSQTIGSVAVNREPVLRWETLATVVGDAPAIRALLDLVSPAAVHDSKLSTAVELGRCYLADGPPQRPAHRSRPPIVRIAHNSPHSTFSPHHSSTGGPALVLRTVTTYDVDPAWDQAADISGREFHDLLANLLGDQPLAGLLSETARRRGFEVTSGSWEPDPDAVQTRRSVAARLQIATTDQAVASLRYGVILSDQQNGSARLIADVQISLDPAQDAQWFPLALNDAARLHLAALACVAEPVANQLLNRIYHGEMPTRAAIEIDLGGSQGGTSARTTTAVADMLDLSPLGPPSRHDQRMPEGLYAVAGDTPLDSEDARKHLLRAALERMARDWGYLDVPVGLPELLA